MLFSKWQPSAILNLRKLQFWSNDLYRHLILHLLNFSLIGQYGAEILSKTIFNMASVPHI